MKNRKFFKLLLLEVLAIVGIGTYFFVDSADIYKLFMGETEFYQQSPTCDLHLSSCKADIPKLGTLEFDIEPKSIPLMKKLTFTVKSTNDVDEFDLHIYATNMNMGYHSFTLKKIAPKTYKAEGILPTCTVGGMIWNAEVVNADKGGLFTFQTK